jgi:uncharacterized protein (TIGR03118 family)
LLSAGFVETNLLSDLRGLALAQDPRLINPWGISLGSEGPFWLADALGGASTIVDGQARSLTGITIPAASFSSGGTPTGTVFNDTTGFAVSENGVSWSSLFLFAGLDGTISGWSPSVDLNHAIVSVNHSASGAVYTGLALADTAGGPFLYAANFGTGQIDVFDGGFNQVQLAGGFVDPNMPAGFTPFNIENIAGNLFVTYAQRGWGPGMPLTGAGEGILDVFDTNGHLLRRLVTGGPLDASWGMTLAPQSFGAFSNDLLVGNLGDGHINAFDPRTGVFLGTVDDAAGQSITIPGLWGLTIGNDEGGGISDALYFTAGIGQEHHGLFGRIVSPSTRVTQELKSERLYGTSPSQDPSQTDNYPLPPSEGPILQGNLISQPAVFSVMLSDSSSSLAAPALVTVVPVNSAHGNTTGQVIAADGNTAIPLTAPSNQAAGLTETGGGMGGATKSADLPALELVLDLQRRLGQFSDQPVIQAAVQTEEQVAFLSAADEWAGDASATANAVAIAVNLPQNATAVSARGLAGLGPAVSSGPGASRLSSSLVSSTQRSWLAGILQPVLAFLLWSGVGLVWRRTPPLLTLPDPEYNRLSGPHALDS